MRGEFRERVLGSRSRVDSDGGPVASRVLVDLAEVVGEAEIVDGVWLEEAEEEDVWDREDLAVGVSPALGGVFWVGGEGLARGMLPEELLARRVGQSPPLLLAERDALRVRMRRVDVVEVSREAVLL